MKTNSEREAVRRITAALRNVEFATANLMEACSSLHSIAGMAHEWELVSAKVDSVKNLWHEVKNGVPLYPDLDPDAKRTFDSKEKI